MLHVYIDKISNYTFCEDVYPLERLSEILSCKSDKVKRQKYASWKLLEYALKYSFNLEIKNLKFTKTNSGKWVSDEVFFSISHSDDLVAVAISKAPVGIDVERLKKMQPNIQEKILTVNELEYYKTLDDTEKNDYLIKCWTGKESVYKILDNTTFNPAKINLCDYTVKTDLLSVENKDYCFSITAFSTNEIKFINLVK